MWSPEENIILINMFNKYKDQLNDDENLEFWDQISGDLQINNIYKSPKECEQQWDSLYNSYVTQKQLNVADSQFAFMKNMDNIFESQEIKIEIINENQNCINVSNGQCPCRNQIISERRKRHNDRVKLLNRKLNIEERKVKAFEEYVKHLKNNL